MLVEDAQRYKVWKYLDVGLDPGASWMNGSFNDSTWPAGPAQTLPLLSRG